MESFFVFFIIGVVIAMEIIEIFYYFGVDQEFGCFGEDSVFVYLEKSCDFLSWRVGEVERRGNDFKVIVYF